jgi:hypothetical protein
MARFSVVFHEWFGLYSGFDCISNFKIKIMLQEILAFAALGISVFFLIKKFFFKKKKSAKNCGNDCGCS